MGKLLERLFEGLLWRSRYMVIFAAVASVIGALLMIGLGCLNIVDAVVACRALSHGLAATDELQIKAIARVIAAVDLFLIATVLLIFGIGLYELFVSKIDEAERDARTSRVLIIHSLDQLKEKLAKVIVMVLVVSFFKAALGLHCNTVTDLVLFALGICLVSAALYLLGRSGSHHGPASAKPE
ncbi:MAG: YqhA family protein [Lentisphaerae bacterium]|nr:YqhA family protein [Lentisphaerota bacterium]